MTTALPKRLIEVDLPIKRISAHARREKSIRHGHISTLHMWWARRPLAACRAVICATLWPDPADSACPPSFITLVRMEMLSWTSHEFQRLLSAESRPCFEEARKNPQRFADVAELRRALLHFIADFANWDNSTVKQYLDTSRALTHSAHEALGGVPGTRPFVVDPFAGGGSIPLEALRIGADSFASDLNPVAVLLNKVVLEYIPRYGNQLAEEVRKWGEWIRDQAEAELSRFYPRDPDGSVPIAYLWARTIQCEGPGCGAEVPLMRSLLLAKRSNRSVALQIVPNATRKQVNFRILVKEKDGWVAEDDPNGDRIVAPTLTGTVKQGSATCPCCGYTTPVERVRTQIKLRKGGVADARLFAVVLDIQQAGRRYRLPTSADVEAARNALTMIKKREAEDSSLLSLTPDETFTGVEPRRIPLPLYGMNAFRDLFTGRQLLSLTTLVRFVREAGDLIRKQAKSDPSAARFADAVQTCLALMVGRQADYLSSLTIWSSSGEFIAHTFGRQALPIVWEWPECNPWAEGSGNFKGAIGWVTRVIQSNNIAYAAVGTAQCASATAHPLPTDSADPPYYYSVPYSDLSDFFYVWLRRMLYESEPDLFRTRLTPKELECVQNLPHSEVAHLQKDSAFYEKSMLAALSEARRIMRPGGLAVVVFAHSRTDAWEALLNALITAGWVVTASWPIDTERAARVIAQRQSTLGSSVHLVCRPRGHDAASEAVGDWRDVLQNLPVRIKEWMPRLAEEGIVGADAIFACIGPALEIFSRYSRVEKGSGESVTLREYLEHVWAAVAKEALSMVFAGADASGFEPDARLTAIWLWTLNAGNGEDNIGESDDEEETNALGDGTKKAGPGGFLLEYDAARKLAQGLGANLESLRSVVQVSGEQARLLPIAERARYLFGKDEGRVSTAQKKKREPQLDLFKLLEDIEGPESTFGETKVGRVGETVLDRIHQSMILFAAGRGEALKRLLVEDGVGHDQRFWRLAQALSALYPIGTDEKRWVDGVLARKKGLGL